MTIKFIFGILNGVVLGGTFLLVCNLNSIFYYRKLIKRIFSKMGVVIMLLFYTKSLREYEAEGSTIIRFKQALKQ